MVAGLLAVPAPAAVALACAVVAAVATSGRWAGGLGAAASGPWAGGLGSGRAASRAGPLTLLAVGAVLAGAVFAQARLAALDRTALGPWIGHDVTVRGFVLEHPRAPGGRLPAAVPGPPWAPGGGSGRRGRSALLRIVAGPGAGERVSVRASRWPAVAPGVEVIADGPLKPLGARDDWLRRRGAHGRLQARGVRLTGRRRGGLAGALDGLRASAERAVSSGLDSPRAALARGMVLGQDEALDEDTREAFRVSGLAHLLAASGQNVMLLAALALPVLAALGFGLRGRLAGVLALIALYVPLAGAGPSIQRAGVMGAAGIVAVLAGRPASRWYALLLAAAVTLAIDPRASQDPGWQLSFAAVVAILLLAQPLAARMREHRVPRPLAEAAAVTAAATLGTAPLLAFHFERVSLVSLPANLLAVAAVAPTMWLGMLAVAAGAVAPALAQLPNAAAEYPLAYLDWLAESAAALPHASVPVQLHSPLALATTYVVLGAAVVLVLRRRPISSAAAPRGRLARAAAALLNRDGDDTTLRRPANPLRAARRALVAVAIAVAVVAFLEGRRLPPPPDPRDVVVSFLDIGQGDATLVQYGGATLLVDTGPPGSPLLQRLREAGVRRIDLLVLTHAQADHDGGAADVLSRLPVGHVLDGGEQVTRLHRLALNAATARHVPRSTPDAGQSIHTGPLELRILWPRREPPGDHPGVDPNDRAIVARLRAGAFDLLLPADAESNVTAALDLPPVEALKVAHHGSEDAGTPDLIARLRPRIAAIEVGRGNTYGHPTPGLLADLRPVPAVYRTDRDGTVRLTVHAGRMSVTTAR
ncbi:MAG: competence protein ComEC [Solirubrobacteraceae bacterium]|jgi:competence protein ComEC|nr:competence protein ComEC [Solirubrobacteraceae bacterium]